MAKKRFNPKQVVTKLRQIDVLMGEGKNLPQAVWVSPEFPDATLSVV